MFEYVDEASFRIAHKDIFRNRIYHFQTDRSRPRIIDGGGGVGLATHYFKKTYPDATVLTFEPDPRIADLLRRNVETNGLDGVRIVTAALSGRDESAAFRPDGADGGRLIGPDHRTDPDDTIALHAQIHVSTVRLSDFVDGPIDFLKLNIEGAEWEVLSDMEQTGKLALMNELVVEYHGWPGGDQRLGDILNLLDRAGFRYLVHDFDQPTGPTSKPPFRIRHDSPWFCLIYGRRESAGAAHSNVARETPRRLTPVSRRFGLDRGTPIDRYYIKGFLARHDAEVRGRVLEIGDNDYTQEYGAGRVTHGDVLGATKENRRTTIVGDLQTGDGVASEAYDCIILTQTLQLLFQPAAAIRHVHRALAPGGVVLVSAPGITQISRYDMDRWGDYWRFTSLALRRLFETDFDPASVQVEAHGNVWVAHAFLQGMAAEELTANELDYFDRDYEVVITVCARKEAGE